MLRQGCSSACAMLQEIARRHGAHAGQYDVPLLLAVCSQKSRKSGKCEMMQEQEDCGRCQDERREGSLERYSRYGRVRGGSQAVPFS